MHLEPLPASRFEEWRAGVRGRFADRRVAAGGMGPCEADTLAEEILARLLPHGPATPDQHVSVLDPAGTVWLQVSDDPDGRDAFVYDVVLGGADPRDAMRAVEQAAVSLGALLIRVHAFAGDADVLAMVEGGGYQPAVTQMRLSLAGTRPSPSVAGRSVVLRPMSAAELDDYRRGQEEAYASDLVRSGAVSTTEALGKAAEELAELLPEGPPSPGHHFWTALDGDRRVGRLWLEIEEKEHGRHAFVLDLEVDAEMRRRGYGRAIMHAAESQCQQRGVATIGLSVFGFNQAARALYDDLGYQVTEQVLRKRL